MYIYTMTISKKSIKIFVSLNAFLVCLATIQELALNSMILENYMNTLLNVFLIFISRNYLLLFFVNQMSTQKPHISNNAVILPKEDYKYEFDINVMSSATIEAISHIIINNYYIFNIDNTYYDLVYFIPISFLFEICFDLFHYIGHRTLHNKYLYQYIHKTHHKFQNPTAITTFYQDPIDIVLTNALPIYLTLCIVPKLSYFQFNLIIIYKTYGEICGHVSKKCYPTGSFCQFIWLPKMLNIELYTEDHYLHHSLNNCNYSKRFSLWDKLFGTFKQIH